MPHFWRRREDTMSKITLSQIAEAVNKPTLIDVSNLGLCCGFSFSILTMWSCVRFPDVMHSIPSILPSGNAELAVIIGLAILWIPGAWCLRQSLRMRAKVKAWEQKEKGAEA